MGMVACSGILSTLEGEIGGSWSAWVTEQDPISNKTSGQITWFKNGQKARYLSPSHRYHLISVGADIFKKAKSNKYWVLWRKEHLGMMVRDVN